MRIGLGLGLGMSRSGGGIRSLFSGGKAGAWFDPTAVSTLWQESNGTVPVTALGQSIGRIDDRSGNGNHATQETSTKKPVLPAAGWRLRTDWVDDVLACDDVGAGREMWVNTPWGHYRSQNSGAARLPLNDATGVVIHEGLTDPQRTTLAALFGTSKKYMVLLRNALTFANMRVYTGGTTTNVTFVGANGVSVDKAFSDNSNSTIDVTADGLTAPVAVVYPDSLSSSATLTHFYCYTNQLTGSIPSLSANTALANFYCYTNQLTGSIPSLTANTALQQFYCNTNQLTGWTGGTVSSILGEFLAQNNLLTQGAVDAILAAFVAANKTTGTRNLNVGGTGNATPSAAGLADKATLVSRGWTVTTN